MKYEVMGSKKRLQGDYYREQQKQYQLHVSWNKSLEDLKESFCFQTYISLQVENVFPYLILTNPGGGSLYPFFCWNFHFLV